MSVAVLGCANVDFAPIASRPENIVVPKKLAYFIPDP